MDQAAYIAVETLNAARRWGQARAVLRRVLDSKTASSQQVEKAKNDHSKAIAELESYVMRLEHVVGKQVSAKRRSKTAPFPWREMLGAVAAVAKAADSALGPEQATRVEVINPKKIIDVEGE